MRTLAAHLQLLFITICAASGQRRNGGLYVLGNGFDLMHGVRSSYYSFRDTIGKNNSLRNAIENYITQEDAWADFEASLAHFNVKAMSNRFVVEDALDISGAYDENAGAAEFYMAVEYAADPILTVQNDLQRRFRMWVETLTIGTDDRPLSGMIKNGKVLCFNYTEFVEALYGTMYAIFMGAAEKRNIFRKRPLYWDMRLAPAMHHSTIQMTGRR